MKRTSLRVIAPFLASATIAAPVKVFILSGQSNMGGSGIMSELTNKGYTAPANVKLFRDQDGCPEGSLGCLADDHTWRPLRVQASDWSFGPEMGIGEVLSRKYPNETVYLLKASWGGTMLSKQPPNKLWEFDNGMDGWSAVGTSTALSWNTNGTVGATITGNDPIMLSPDMRTWNVAISSTTNNIIRVKMRNLSSSTSGRIYFQPVGGSWNETNAKSFSVVANDPTSREYVIDMSTVPSWNGMLAQFRIDPSLGPSGSYAVDHVRIESSSLNRVWEFGTPAGLSGWTANGSITGFTLAPPGNGIPNDGCLLGSISAADPFVYSPDQLNVNIDSSKTLRIRLWNNTPDREAQIYFSTNASTSFSESKSVVFPVVPHDNGFREYIVDMSGNASWKGTLRRLRVDPVRFATTGAFAIDKIQITGWAKPAWLNGGSDLYPWFLRNVRKALNDLTSQGLTYELKGFFWMQGESDATTETTAPIYDQNLAQFVAKVRSDLGAPSLPFLYGMIHSASLSTDQYLIMMKAWYNAMNQQHPTDQQILANYWPEMWLYSEEVQAAQYRAQSTISNSRCVEGPAREATKVAGCSASYGTPSIQHCDPAHYGTDALLSVGRHFGNAWLEYSNGSTVPGCQNPANWD